jgi:hypothetical protein
VLAFAILALWFVVVGAHIRREYFRPETDRIALGARSLAPGSYFYVVRMNGTAIGTASMRLDTVRSGFRFSDDLLMDVPALDTVQRAAAMTRITLGPMLELRGFTFRLDSKIGSFLARGVAVADSGLDLRIEAGGRVQSSRVAGEDLLLDAVLPMRLAASGRLGVGREFSARVFDPSALSVREVSIRVTAADTLVLPDSARLDAGGAWVAQVWDTIPVWRIEQQFGGVTLGTWVDEDGLVVRAESPLGLELERTAFELARQEWTRARSEPGLAAGYGALIESTAIASNVDLRGIAAAPRLAVRLAGVELEGFDLSGGRQALSGDTLVIIRESEAALQVAGYTLPYRGEGEPAAELGSTPLIQSDDERIRATAKQVTSGTPDPALAARRLNDWVYASVRKEIVPSIPSAVQVLDVLRGDCNEHTVLYVALGRSLGLPARTAVGLVHVRGRFYYHAWPEIWLNGAWVAVDPTLGQFPADASHIRFLVGGLARQVDLIRLIGRLQLEAI